MRNFNRKFAKLTLLLAVVVYLTCSTSLAYSPAKDMKFLDSLEDLLKQQSNLLTNFEYLLHRTPTTSEEKTEFFYSFEDLLRRQANLLSKFEDFLKIRWDCMNIEEQEKFLNSFEDLVEERQCLFPVLKHYWMKIGPAFLQILKLNS